MNSDFPKEKNAIDEQAEAQKSQKKERRFKGWFTLFLAWMALFFTAIGILAGYKNWLRIHDKTKANKATIEVIQTQINNVASNEQLGTIRTELLQKTQDIKDQSSKALTQTQKYMQQSQHYAETIDAQVSEMTKMQSRLQLHSRPTTNKEWILSETEFLIRLANRKLHLDKDKYSAIAALKAADENFARLGSPHFLPVRQQIANDITALEQYAGTKTEELSQKITALMLQLSPLSANDQDISNGEIINLVSPDESTAESDGNSLWSDLKGQAKTAFSDAVIIRKHNKPITSELDADARLQVYQLLQLRLETLRLMVLQGFDKEYHQQIKRLSSTVTQYYPEERAKPLLETIKNLDTYQLNPQAPDISSSIKQLESALLTESTVQDSSSEDQQ